ncbi:MAG: hypothetical protein A2X64_00200 [Ignavibacteria bacterium GWF2_33_9]|nr:MAG: hypothetical protein A2X64_00200 [Ignavibacteria bacterium GWF2_33_9]
MKIIYRLILPILILLFLSNICSGQDSWETKNKGLVGKAYTMHIFDVNNTFWLLEAYPLYKSTDLGGTWEQQTLGYITGAEDLVYQDSMIVMAIAAGDYGWAVVKSTNNGQTWYNASKGLGDSVHLFYATIAMKDNYLFLGSTGAITRCPELGEGTWEKKSNYVNLESWKKPMPNKIRSFDKYLFIADNNNGVWASTDLGENWYKKSNGLSFEGVFDIQCFDNVLYASTYGGGICRSYDWGENWERITPTEPYELTRINSVFVKGNTILAATYDEGMYISRDNGLTWGQEESSYNFGLTHGGVFSFFEKDEYLYVCYFNFGVCRTKLSDIINSAKEAVWEPITKTFPNPASDKVTIEVEGIYSNIQFCNVPGESIQIENTSTILSEKTIFTLNTTQIPRGTYFYKISNGEKVVKGKFNKY